MISRGVSRTERPARITYVYILDPQAKGSELMKLHNSSKVAKAMSFDLPPPVNLNIAELIFTNLITLTQTQNMIKLRRVRFTVATYIGTCEMTTHYNNLLSRQQKAYKIAAAETATQSS